MARRDLLGFLQGKPRFEAGPRADFALVAVNVVFHWDWKLFGGLLYLNRPPNTPNSALPPISSEERTAMTDEKEPAATPAKDTSHAKRILIVDDDPDIIESVRFPLEKKGYEVLIARDGNQGLTLAEKELPDLVILDMMMPKRSGFLVLEKLRRTHEQPMRVIMITANEGSRHKAYAEMLGVDDYIRKPFAMDRLIDSVEKLLG